MAEPRTVRENANTVDVLCTGKLHTLALHLLQDGADAGVGVLHIVYGVVVVGLDGLIQIKVDAAACVVHIEQETCAVNGHFFQQVGQGDGVAGALGHTDRLAVSHQVDHLHQHNGCLTNAWNVIRCLNTGHTGNC